MREQTTLSLSTREGRLPLVENANEVCTMIVPRCLIPLLALGWFLAPTAIAEESLPPVSERARRVHDAGMLFDGHNDLPWRLREAGDVSFERLDLARRLPSGQTDIPRLREGGVK